MLPSVSDGDWEKSLSNPNGDEAMVMRRSAATAKPALSHLLFTVCVYFSPWMVFSMKQ